MNLNAKKQPGISMEQENKKPTGGETWQDKMPKVPRYYSPVKLLERRVSRLEKDLKDLKNDLGR